ncbi:hypothetical protein VTH8203_03893 [Vibrio thalassae]|uniref:Uncharacterized protein n=1 Tax=Vibrio thalassae TaxID=1243014 RepID=A0A240ENL2_9VIBR|nr:hypothetical protein [Vibrio thalassae]SNX50238.1 hypothetical protein VTH8203_03893 [Vibrio thalassae]
MVIKASLKKKNVVALALYPVFKLAASGGIWPDPYSVDHNVKLTSLFYNRTSDGTVDKIEL